MPATIIPIEVHPRFHRWEPEVYILDEDEQVTVGELLQQIRLSESISCQKEKEVNHYV